MIDYLLNKFQPQRFTSNKKDAIRTFEQWLFSAVGQAASYSPQEMHRLLCGAGKKTGLLNACGGQSKKSGTLQKASIMALLLLKRMCSSDFKSHQTVQRVFVSCNMLHIESMMLRLHEEEGRKQRCVDLQGDFSSGRSEGRWVEGVSKVEAVTRGCESTERDEGRICV